jgi:hypothetical protein
LLMHKRCALCTVGHVRHRFAKLVLCGPEVLALLRIF